MATESGTICKAKVIKITKAGAMVRLPGGQPGFIHISEIADTYVANVEDYFSEGDHIQVKVLGMNQREEVALSFKQAKIAASPLRVAHPAFFSRREKPILRVFNGLPSKPVPQTFDEKLKLFMRTSEEKLGELKRNLENKRGGGRKRL